MAQMQIGDAISFPAGADLSASSNLYKIVKLNSSQQVILSSAATDKHVGVLHNLPKSGEAASVMARNASGVVKVQAGGTIAIGDYLTANASGLAIATTTGNDEVIGIATEAGASGQVVSCLAANSRY
jgi:hypothetical protein